MADMDQNKTYPQGLPTREMRYERKWHLPSLTKLTAADLAPYRFFWFHMPAAVAELVPATTTLTVLREPIAQTVSLLAQLSRGMGYSDNLETLYNQAVVRRQLRNYQTRVFSFSMAELEDHHTASLVAQTDPDAAATPFELQAIARTAAIPAALPVAGYFKARERLRSFDFVGTVDTLEHLSLIHI